MTGDSVEKSSSSEGVSEGGNEGMDSAERPPPRVSSSGMRLGIGNAVDEPTSAKGVSCRGKVVDELTSARADS